MKFATTILTLALLVVGLCRARDQPLCTCPRNYDPICASDGETYGNECIFNCQKARSAALRMVGHGTCLELNRNNLENQPYDF